MAVQKMFDSSLNEFHSFEPVILQKYILGLWKEKAWLLLLLLFINILNSGREENANDNGTKKTKWK